MMEGILSRVSAVIPAKVLPLEQFPQPLESGMGSTEVFLVKNTLAESSAVIHRDAFILNQYPEPRESHIGEGDLPGGFRHSAIISGQKHPFQDLARGIIQVDGVKVLFDAKA